MGIAQAVLICKSRIISGASQKIKFAEQLHFGPLKGNKISDFRHFSKNKSCDFRQISVLPGSKTHTSLDEYCPDQGYVYQNCSHATGNIDLFSNCGFRLPEVANAGRAVAVTKPDFSQIDENANFFNLPIAFIKILMYIMSVLKL